MMTNIIARTYFGAIYLYHGIPELKEVQIIDVKRVLNDNEYKTTLVIKDVKGNIYNITIGQSM